MSHTAVVAIAPLATAERMGDAEWQRPGRMLYWRNALKFLPTRTTVPLVVDHDMSREIGTVHDLFAMDWLDGKWICARATLSDPPGWLRAEQTRASFGSWPTHVAEDKRVSSAFVKEVSLLSADHEPVEPRARLLSLRRTEARPAHTPVPVPVTAPVIWRAAPMHEEDEEIAELHRRLTWHEARGTSATLESILEGMKHELRMPRRGGRLRLVG